MLNPAGIFSSNRVVLSIDQKQLVKKRKKKVTIIIAVIEVGKLIHLVVKLLFSSITELSPKASGPPDSQSNTLIIQFFRLHRKVPQFL